MRRVAPRRAWACRVLTHTDEASCGLEQIAALVEAGVAPHRILVGHSDTRDDHAYQHALAERGAYVGFDRFGLETLLKDEVRIQGVLKMIEAGYLQSVCISHDATCAAWLGRPSFDGRRVVPPAVLTKVLPNWEPSHIFKHILPSLRERGVSEAQLRTLMVENPTRYFQGDTPPARAS